VKQKRKDNMDARKQAAELAKMGRYGDTMLMHVNPQEVAGLASIMPITINPKTGQPEAFVGAILGSLLGGAFFPNLLGAGFISTAAGGAALGSGLGTYLETGDLEKGIASAVLGYGSGQIMGDIISGPVEETLAEGLTDTALTQAGDIAAQQTITAEQLSAAAQQGIPLDQLTPEMQTQIDILGDLSRQEAMNRGLTPLQIKDITEQAALGAEQQFMDMSGTERLGKLASNFASKDTIQAVADNYLPIALGGGSLAAQNAQDRYLQDMDRLRAEREKKKEEMYKKYPELIHSRNPYLTYFSAEGGQVPAYQEGGIVGVGNEGQYRPANTYMPGIDSEFNFFPDRVIPASAISAAEAAAGTSQEFTPPPVLPSTYQPMTLPRYDYDAVPTGSVISRVQDAYNAGLPLTTQLLSPFRNVGLELAQQGAGRTFTQYGSDITQEGQTQTGQTQTQQQTQNNPNKKQTNADTYVNTQQEYDTGGGKTNVTDSDLTNNPGSTVIDNNDGTSTVIYEDGTQTTVANSPYTEDVVVTSNTDPVTGQELQPGDPGYVDPSSDEYTEAVYGFGSGGGKMGMNPYLGDPASAYSQVELNRQTLLNAAREAGVYEAYDAAIQAGIPADNIIIATADNAAQIAAADDDTVIVSATGYGTKGSTADGTFVYTNTDPLLGYVADSTENKAPGERRMATSGILIGVDGSRTQIDDLSTFRNPMDGSVIELNNGYSVLNVPEVGNISYAGVGMFAEDPSQGGNYERDPAVRSAGYIYKTLNRAEQDAKRTAYQQALADALARGDIPSADYEKLRTQTYEDYLAYLEAQEKQAEEEAKQEDKEETEDKEEEQEDRAYVEGDDQDMQAGMQVPNIRNADMSRELSLQQEIREAVLGNHPNPDKVIQAYIEQFGVDAFLQARDLILRQQVPNAQTQGLVMGMGGGMEDNIMGMIGNQQGVAVSPGEYIIPADVVSMLGDGNSNEGSDKLDDMLDRVRTEKTGTTKQAAPLNDKKVMAG
tara:strand:- start:2866 stop:5859 length:2994 start_codon:yes stop_codon:yes gene_type:complete